MLLGALFAAMLAVVALGRRLRAGRSFSGLSALEGAVFGLMGLLLAFTFGSAAVRFETRRNLIVEEANDIGTAYLRLDLLPEAAQPALRQAFRQYVDARLDVYRALPDFDAARTKMERVQELQSEIWAASVAACGETGSPQASMLLLPALNAMIDITTTRTVAIQTHQPGVVFVMLAVVMLTCALLAGLGMESGESRSWLHVVCFTLVMTIAFYVILDLEYPRVGLIRIDWMDQVLVDVRDSMR